MKNKFLLLLCIYLSCCLSAHAQRSAKPSSGYTFDQATDGTGNYFAIRAKFWPWIWPGTSLVTGLGFEYGFNKRHSVSLEYELGYHGESHDTDEKDNGPLIAYNYKGIVATYKRYFVFKGVLMYTGLFGKKGEMYINVDKGYPTNTVKYFEDQYSGGALIGMQGPLSKRWSLDMNLGPFYKWKHIYDTEQDNSGNLTSTVNRAGNWGLRICADFMFQFHSGSGHWASQNLQGDE